MSTGQIIQNKRQKAGLTAKALAELVGVTQPHITQIERGTKGVSLALAAEFAKVFGCKIQDLVDDNGI